MLAVISLHSHVTAKNEIKVRIGRQNIARYIRPIQELLRGILEGHEHPLAHVIRHRSSVGLDRALVQLEYRRLHRQRALRPVRFIQCDQIYIRRSGKRITLLIVQLIRKLRICLVIPSDKLVSGARIGNDRHFFPVLERAGAAQPRNGSLALARAGGRRNHKLFRARSAQVHHLTPRLFDRLVLLFDALRILLLVYERRCILQTL